MQEMPTTPEPAPLLPFDRSKLRSPFLRRFLDYWDRKRGDRPMPDFADLDPLEFPWALGNLTLVDVLEEPRRYRFRLVGSQHASRLGMDMTGKLVADFPSAALRTILTKSYDEAVAAGQPLHRTRWDVVAGISHHYEALLLPLSSRPPTIDMLAVCAEYVDRERRR